MVAFLLTALAVTFPTCWLPAHSRARYFMSLYPCLAPLIGLTIQRCWELRERGFWQRSWDRYLVAGIGLIAASGVVVVAARLGGSWRILSFGQAVSSTLAFGYVLSAVAAVAAVLWSRSRYDLRHASVGLMAVAAFMGLTYTGVVVSVQMQSSNNPSATIAAIRDMIPPGERLVSFGKVHHLFAYYYGGSIELQKMGTSNVATETPGTYFCYAVDPKFKPPRIPFAWDQVADISCERMQSPRPATKVVVGRRRSDPLAVRSDESSDSHAATASTETPATAVGFDGLFLQPLQR